MATIRIDSSSSTCENCNKSASPSDNGHTTIYGYDMKENGKPGCGEPWTAVRLSYGRFNTETKKLEPVTGFIFENLRGLPLVGFDDNLTYPYEGE